MIYLPLDKTASSGLSRQICDGLRSRILEGILQPEDRLPSTRELAKSLGVSRNAVIACYEQLTAEGFVYSKNGSGTYVCEGVCLPQDAEAKIQHWSGGSPLKKQHWVSFRTGIPDLEKIPVRKWAQSYQRAVDKITAEAFDYQEPFGDYELRRQLAHYLNRARGTSLSPENLMITNGAAQAFQLLCSLIGQGEYAVVENPLSYGILHTLQSNGVNMLPVSVDGAGMETAKLPDADVKLIFTTPSHQFPTGVILTAARRIELIQYAKQKHAYIVEDDYDSEFRFEGNPVQSMQSLAPEQVIYTGTFSKTLMPSLRIGYLALPDALCERMREIKYVADLHSPTLEQRALAEFLADGSYEHHIWKMKKWYLQKRNHLTQCIQDVFQDEVRISGMEAGLHFMAEFDTLILSKERMQRLEAGGIEISTVSHHYLPAAETAVSNALIFGYGNTRMEDMEKGVTALKKILLETRNPNV